MERLLAWRSALVMSQSRVSKRLLSDTMALHFDKAWR